MEDSPQDRKRPEVQPLGDAGALIKLGDRIDESLHARTQGMADSLRLVAGVCEVVASYSSVTVHYEPAELSYRSLRRTALKLGNVERHRNGRLYEIPVVYDGPDLVGVARDLSISVARVIELHCEPIYRVFLIGFSPGLPYLGPLRSELRLPRRKTPRTRVPAGSVAIAADQATIYTFPTPGGWHLLGRTSTQLFLPESDPPTMLRAGDFVKFVPSATQ
jgi:KipI family sensor histidine kinase inhibitor